MTGKQTKTNETFSLFRHVRSGSKGRVSNLGGVTLYLEVDQVTSTFQFGFAVCGEGENFNKTIAKNVAFGRFAKGKKVFGEYDRNKSLVDNCINALDELVNGGVEYKDNVPGVSGSQAAGALSHLRRAIKKLPRAPFTGARTPIGTVILDEAKWPWPTSPADVAFSAAELG